jgi:GT2 family glycosyltransferase
VTVSVVVPILNAASNLVTLCSALAALAPQPEEILLVDNGSTDDGPQRLSEFARTHRLCPVHVLREPRRGASAARNAGVAAARGQIVAFTDADCAPTADWLSKLGDPFLDPQVGAVAGSVEGAVSRSTLPLFCALYTLRLGSEPARLDRWTPWTGGFPTANLAVRRETLDALGGFDTSVELYGEDYDLCARIYERDLRIVYLPAATVTHHHRATVPSIARQAYGFGRSHAYLLRKHAEGVWFEFPGYALARPRWPVRIWVDVASADKKLAAALILGAVYPPLVVGLPAYLAWLTASARRRARDCGTPVPLGVAAKLAALLLVKSAAMTAGRWYGSVKYGALCF